MSALGQKRFVSVMSALPPKADIAECQYDVPLCQKRNHHLYSITSSALSNSTGHGDAMCRECPLKVGHGQVISKSRLLSASTNKISRSFVVQMVAQQNTKPVEGSTAHHLEGVPQTDLVRGQHGFSQIML